MQVILLQVPEFLVSPIPPETSNKSLGFVLYFSVLIDPRQAHIRYRNPCPGRWFPTKTDLITISNEKSSVTIGPYLLVHFNRPIF